MSIDSQYIGDVLLRTVGCVLAFGLGAFGQSEEPKVVVNLDGLRYPLIAAEARITGNVIFEASGTEHTLIFTANPLLTPAAEGNLKE